MQCDQHPDKKAVAVCLGCYKGICPECRHYYDGKSVCEECLASINEMETQNTSDNLIADVENEFSKAQEKVNNFIKENKIDEELGKFKNEANDLADDFYNKLKDFKLKKYSNKGFLICENYSGYYELQKTESPDDFEECECGGKLKFSKNLNNKFL